MKEAATRILATAVAALACAEGALAQAQDRAPIGSVERGRYLAQVAGCNDCHTPGYSQTGGKVPEAQWLTGDRLGWQGPWGTTYPANLRLTMARMSEQEWVKFARTTQLRPPMPWFALRDMATEDLVSIYRYIRSLGPAGEPAPAYMPPGTQPAGMVVKFPG